MSGAAHDAAADAAGTWDTAALHRLVDLDDGVLDRRIYADPSLFELELRNVFARGWNFMCHDSQLREAGDYVVGYIGRDQVIVVRDEQGEVNVMLNTCRHRGNALCRAEKGRAKSFVCSYHGWNYGLDGRLVGVPGQSTYYRGALDRDRWGLHRAAKVESCHGFHFATLAPEAPPLHDFLGEIGRAGLGMVAAHGDVELIDGVQKNVVDCNWKIAVDNLFDWYHVMFSHASANSSGFLDLAAQLRPREQLVLLGDYGHAISGPAITKARQAEIDRMSDAERAAASNALPPGVPRLRSPATRDVMGSEGVRSFGHPNIFPNLWVTMNGFQVCLRLPRGPSHTELWWFTFVPKGASPDLRRAIVRAASHMFGPAGLLEQDDGENWSQSTRASHGVVASGLGHALQMGLGQDRVEQGEGDQHHIDTCINEHGQRWFYRAWRDWMSARSWAELDVIRARVGEGAI